MKQQDLRTTIAQRYQQFFSQVYPVPLAVVEALLDTAVEREYDRGAVITREGQVQRDMLLIVEGVQMSYLNHDGKHHVIAFSYGISPTGIPESFTFQKPSDYVLQALTKSRFLAISYQNFMACCDEHRALERAILLLNAAWMEGIIKRHMELQTCTIEERFRRFAQRSPHLFQLVPHKYIANYLHISPTNFSKLFNSIKI